MKFIRAACAAVTIAIIACGCQHIPPAPLTHESVTGDLAARPLEIPPIQDFAQSLSAADGQNESPFDVEDGISLREAKAIALWYNPDVREARLVAQSADVISNASGRWPDPEIGVGTGKKREESGDSSTLSIDNTDQSVTFTEEAGDIERSWVSFGSLSITIPLSGRYGAQKKLRRAERDAAILAATEAEWQTLRNLEVAWVQWSATHDHIALLEDHIATLTLVTESAEALANAGELAPANARVMRIELGRLGANRDRLRYEELAQRAGLHAMMGLTPDAPVTLLPSWGESQDTPEDATLPADHPSLQHAIAEYDIAEKALRVELRKQYPDIVLTPNYSDEGSETTFVVGMGVPVPLWNQNREGIAQAVAARDAARLRAERTYQDMLLALRQSEAQYAGASAQWNRLSTETAKLLDTQIKETQTLLRVGEMDIAILYEVMGQVLATKLELLEARTLQRTADIHIYAAINPQSILPTSKQDETP